MSLTAAELLYRRGQLVERIGHQRAALARDLAPVRSTLNTADQALGAARNGLHFLKAHPLVVTLLLSSLVAFKPGRVVRLLRRGLVVWKTWRTLRAWGPRSLSSSLPRRVWQFVQRRYF